MERRRILLLALAVTVGLSWMLVPGDDDHSGSPQESKRLALAGSIREPRTTPMWVEPGILAIRDRSVPSQGLDAFAVRNWAPIPTVAAPPPPATPSAPPLPFSYLGRLEQGGSRVALLGSGGHGHVAAVGDVLLDHYRIEDMDEEQLVIRYLPLGILQTLPRGADQ